MTSKAKPRFKIGQKVIAADLRSLERGRKAEKGEGEGIVRDLFHPHGRQTSKKDLTAPYYVELSDGSSSWYDEDELQPATKKARSRKAAAQASQVDMYWVEQGRRWAREDVAKPAKLARIQKPGFDAEGQAGEYMTEVSSPEEAEAMEGWIEARYGYRTELEKLTGLKFLNLTGDLIKEA